MAKFDAKKFYLTGSCEFSLVLWTLKNKMLFSLDEPKSFDNIGCGTAEIKFNLHTLLGFSGGSCDPKIGEDGFMKLEVTATPSFPLRIVSFSVFFFE